MGIFSNISRFTKERISKIRENTRKEQELKEIEKDAIHNERIKQAPAYAKEIVRRQQKIRLESPNIIVHPKLKKSPQKSIKQQIDDELKSVWR